MALQGTLETFTVPDVLRLLATTKKTGQFTLDGDRGTGQVWLDDGQICGATSDREHGGDVDSVLFDLLRFNSGSFRFEPDAVPPADQIVDDHEHDGDVEQSLARAEALLGEWREIETVIPSMDAWVRLLPDIEGESVTIDAALWQVLAVLGSGSTGRRVGSELDLGELEACRRLRDLVELEVAEVDTEFVSAVERMGLSDPAPAAVEPPPPPPPPPPPAAEVASYDEPPVEVEAPAVVANNLSHDEVANLGANLASFVAVPSADDEVDRDAPEAFGEVSVVDADESFDEVVLADHADDGHSESSFGIEFGAPESADQHDFATNGEAVESPDEFLSQLANLSPKAAAAIEAIEGPEQPESFEPTEPAAISDDFSDGMNGASDEEINKNLLLKFLSSAKN